MAKFSPSHRLDLNRSHCKVPSQAFHDSLNRDWLDPAFCRFRKRNVMDHFKIVKDCKTLAITDSESLAKEYVSKHGGEICPATQFEFDKWQDWSSDVEIES